MRAGDTEFFDVAEGNAGVIQYELDLLKVMHDKVKSKAAAAHASRVNKDGKNVVQELKAEGDMSMGRYVWSAKRGVLVRRHSLRVKASASSANSASQLVATSSVVLGTAWGG
jgi:hypothetical protein